jgi:glutamate dehydrogenase
VKDHFDRLALDRAIDAIAAAHRRLTAEVVAQGGAGPGGVADWSRSRGAEMERIRTAVETITASGLTLSKLSVAASLLGDLARA